MMFKLRCENCGYEDDIDEFLINSYSYKDKDDRFDYVTVTVECPMCNTKYEDEFIKE